MTIVVRHFEAENSASFLEPVSELFANNDDGCGSSDVSEVDLSHLADKVQLQSVLRLAAEHGARRVVWETEYVDRHYLEDYVGYYSRCFSRYRRRCARAHFLKAEIEEGALIELLVRADERALNKVGYIGYCVIKPLPHTVVGRTALPQPMPHSAPISSTAIPNRRSEAFASRRSMTRHRGPPGMPEIHPKACVASEATIGEGTVIRQFASVTGGTVLGRDCSVSPFAMLHGPVIGDRCRISGGVMMGPGFLIEDDVFIGPNVTLANDAWPRADKAGYRPEEFDGTRWAVIIEDGASIGANSVILPGVRIGTHAMVAAGSVVTRDVPPAALWSGGSWRHVDGEKERMRFVR